MGSWAEEARKKDKEVRESSSSIAQREQNRPPIRGKADEEAIDHGQETAAASLRAKGNESFRTGNYSSAESRYTESLQHEETAAAYANRAMARLKLGDNKGANEDCTSALEINPKYLKAWQRRSHAKSKLGDLLGSAVDAEGALVLDPTSEALRRERRIAKERYESTFGAAIQHPPRRVPFRSNEGQAQNSAANVDANATEKEQKGKDEGFTTSIDEAATRATRIVQSSRPERKPTTGSELEATWKDLEGEIEEQSRLLRSMDPNHLPTLLRGGLSEALLRGISVVALASLSPKEAADWLDSLQQCSRFSIAAMFVARRSAEEVKRSLATAWRAAKGDESVTRRLERFAQAIRIDSSLHE